MRTGIDTHLPLWRVTYREVQGAELYQMQHEEPPGCMDPTSFTDRDRSCSLASMLNTIHWTLLYERKGDNASLQVRAPPTFKQCTIWLYIKKKKPNTLCYTSPACMRLWQLQGTIESIFYSFYKVCVSSSAIKCIDL